MVLCQCGCGEEIKINTKGNYAKFRSGHHSRVNHPLKKEKDRRICPVCNIEFLASQYSKKIYCSLECNYKTRNKPEKYVNLICKNCGKSHKKLRVVVEVYGRGMFCCKKCYTEFSAKQFILKATPSSYRSNAWRYYPKRCCDCGYDKDLRCLVVHHIDGNRKNGNIDNLCIVCHNCHCIRHLNMGVNTTIPNFRTRNLSAYMIERVEVN